MPDSSFQLNSGMVRLDPKWVRLDTKLDKSGAFSDQISVHLAPPRKMHWNLIWKSPGFVPFGANLTHFGAKLTIPASCVEKMRDKIDG